MQISRRHWMSALVGGSITSLLAAFGVHPRFSHGFSVAGARKMIENGPANPAAALGTRGIRCLVIGDWGTGRALQRRVAQGMQTFAGQTHPHFVISTGDNLYPCGVTSRDDPRFQTVFENVYTGADLQIPWHLALGNHDHMGDVESQIAYTERSVRWRLPARYYTFTESSDGVTADFFVLDTEELIAETGQVQLDWLDRELAASTADWKVCVGHHPIRSCGHYGGSPALVRDLKPLLDHHGVVAYLCGHDHDLQVLKSPDDHFVCLVSGGGGKARDARYGDGTLFARTNGGFAALTLSKTGLTAAILDPEGHVDFVEHCLSVERGLALR